MIRLGRILADMKAAGIPQKEVARRIGLTPTHFSAIRNGHQRLQRRTAEAMERVFGVCADWLMDGREPVSLKQEGDELRLSFSLYPDEDPAQGSPEAPVVTQPHCGQCGGRVAPRLPTCPHCGCRLIWPDP